MKSRCGLGCAPSESAPSGLGSCGFPGVSIVQNLPVCVGDSGLIPGSGRSPGEKWQPTPVFLPGKSHGQRSLAGYRPWGLKRVRHDLVTKQTRLEGIKGML